MTTIRVLIVEDDPRIADLHRRFAERVEGCEVVGISHSLADARDMAEILEPDLVLLDLYFPEGSGTDLLREIRAKGLETDVILITAAREVGPLKQALRGGVFDYLIKPVIADRFRDCLVKFREYRKRIANGGTIEQTDVDGLLRPAGTASACRNSLPKGIDPLTLGKVRAVFDDIAHDQGISAEEAAGRIGASRSTARRYLEYLVSIGSIYADVVYGVVGRPERKYFLCTQPGA
ncbi:MAG: response regulator [Desulfovibrionaceae bacterium]|jgi:two-component system CitB family response regulator/two-component system response regulator DcuR|nr:response regulator [Desulfovibrionaceae bacterium]